MNEKIVIRAAVGITAVVMIAVPALLLTMQTPGIGRIPVPQTYSQGMALNSYVNLIMPAVIVLSILFIAGLSTFGLYHGVTRELLGTKPLIHRPFGYIMNILHRRNRDGRN